MGIIIILFYRGGQVIVTIKFCPTISGYENTSAEVLYNNHDTWQIPIYGAGIFTVNVISNISLLNNSLSLQLYPNPTIQQAQIIYKLPSSQHITVGIYNIFGQWVQNLKCAYEFAGNHEIDYDCSQLPNGVYYIQLRSQGGVVNNEMVVLH